MEKLDGMTKDLVKENIEKLKELFPTIVKEDKIDFEELQLILGEDINNNKEQYSFVWNGKTEATKLAQKRSTGTLRPCKEESKNWDTTKNIYIEGDNLEVLKLLQSSYNGRIKMIYIDPPYNTGHDFVYKDNFEDNIANYKEVTGQAQKSNADTDGRYHTNWLNMIYPRLKLARTLLKDDGVIFISIDDNEQANMKKVCDEVFGEDNYVQEIIWQKKFSPQNDAKYFSLNHESILCYAKNKSLFKRKLLPITDEMKKRYKNLDNDPRGPWTSGDCTIGRITEKDYYAIKTPSGREVYPSQGNVWRFSKETFQQLIADNRIWFGTDGNNMPRVKRFLSETNEGIVPISIWSYEEVGHTQSASQDLKKLFDDKDFFDYPKPVKLIKKCLLIATNKDDLVLDFFSGTATTAHAVMQLNAEDGGNRKFICVQLPELTEETSEAYRQGYKNICEIGKERIRRAGEQIKNNRNIKINIDKNKLMQRNVLENGDFDDKFAIKVEAPNEQYLDNLDIGFKVFKLDSSNLKKWNNTPTKDADEVAKRIQISLDYLENDRTELDLVYEIMLKYGIDLTLPITKTANEKAYIVNGEEYKLLICSQMNLKLEDIEEFANESVGTYLFADRCFSDDNLLINAQEILKAKNKEMRLF